jgi:hypothetical protein
MRSGVDRDITRDLRPHPTRSEVPTVTALTNVLTPSLGWHRARMKLKAGVEERSNDRRIRRFLADYEVDDAALSELFVRLVPQDPPYRKPPYVLVLDRTEWHFGQTLVNVLMIGIAHRGIAHRGIAFPVAWTALPKSGGSGSESRSRSWRRGAGRRAVRLRFYLSIFPY